jgi:hypothetical protein
MYPHLVHKILSLSNADLPNAPFSRNLTPMVLVVVGLKAHQLLQLFAPNSHVGEGFTVLPSRFQ